MSWFAWWRWLRSLKENPVYRREKGEWGNPNPLYKNLSRFSPFVVLGAIFVGICAGGSNSALLAGNADSGLVFALLCLPGILLSMVTNFGAFMAPALTTPIISGEVDKGTWDILRLTPHPTGTILLAKLIGALARLRIWLLLFALSLLQGGIVVITAVITGEPPLVWSVVLGLTAVVRPWLEIIFAASLGMYISTWVYTSMLALATTYGGLLLVKIFNSSALWAGFISGIGVSEGWLFFWAIFGPTLIYILFIAALAWGIYRRSESGRQGAVA